MRPTQFITLEIYQNDQWVDYTDGLIDVEIIRGVEEYTGPLVQPDVGQLTLKSRNPSLDPYDNNFIRYNAKIRVNAGSTRIFTGRIEGVDVEYGPRTQPTIVTINAFDMIGTMYKHILSESFINQLESWTTTDLLGYLSSTGEIAEWQNYVISTDGTEYSEGRIQSNTTAYDALNTRAKTDLGFYFANARNEIEYYRRDRDDPLLPFNADPALITFDYDGNATSYRAISLNDGFEKIVNEVVITGVGNTDTTKVVVTSGDSVDLWGKTSATTTLATDSIANLQAIGNEILVEMAEPVREIYEISWDGTLDPDVAKTVDILDNIHITHRVNPTTTIDRKYAVVGLKHEINADEWLITYIVRNYDYQSTSIPNPVIVISPESGGSEVDFTFSYTHPNPELITGQSWNLDDGFTSTAPSTVVNYLVPGTKTITLTIDTIYGYTKTTSVELEVGIAPPIAAFTYSLDANNVYNFSFTGTGLGQIFWDFGDGTGSTDTNPSKFYLTSGPKTVTCTVTNSFGFDTETQIINTVATTVIPVRYVKIKWTGSLNDNSTTSGYASDPFRVHSLKFYDTSNIELGAGYTLVDYKDINGFFTTSPRTLDEYGRTQRTDTSHAELQDKLKGSSGTYPISWYAGEYIGSTTLEGKQKTYRIATTFDLGTNYFSFKELKLTRALLSGAAPTAGNSNLGIVEVSYDNVNWRHIGELAFVGSNTISTFTPVATPPFTFANSPVPSVEYDWTPVRYVKFLFNAPTPTTPNYWMIRNIVPIAGIGNPQNTGVPNDNDFGLGGVNTSGKTGANLTFDATNSSGVNSIIKTFGSPNTITQSIINPGTSGITNWNNIDQLPGSGNITNGITWQETTGEKTFTYDLGQLMYNFNGLEFRLGRYTLNSIDEVNVMDGGYTVTISLSADNINYTTIGTFSLDYTQSGGLVINSQAYIRTTPELTTSGATNYYWYRPVHSGSTWMETNHLGYPTGLIT